MSQVSISKRSKFTYTDCQAVRTKNVEVPKLLVSMLRVLQIHVMLFLAQLFSSWIILVDTFTFRESTIYFLFSDLMPFGT